MKTKQILITLLVCCVSISMSAAEWTDANGTVWKFTTSGSNANLYNSGYDSAPCISGTIPTTLTIPSTVYIGETAYAVTSIGFCAFYNCSSLTSINIPEGVTSIGGSAFLGCSSLASINIPEGVTSIGGSAFQSCSSLTSINIPEGVTSIEDQTFLSCSSLTSINIPEGVTSIEGYAFSGCSSLTSINIPEGVTSIEGNAFYDCSSLKSIHIPEGVTSIGNYAFYGCSSLTSINIPEGVTSIGVCAFSGCSSLTSINILEGVTSIGSYAFDGCSSLISINIPESVTSIGKNAFHDCYDIRSLYIKDLKKYLQISFGNDESSPTFYSSNVDLYLNNTLATALEIPEGVTQIPACAFRNCSKLTSVTIPEGVTSIGDRAFRYCSSLTSINIPKGVTAIGNQAFCNCSSLTSINIPKGVTAIGYQVFYGIGGYFYCEDATPCTIGSDAIDNRSIIFVPDNAVEAYRAAWTSNSDIIVGNSHDNLVEVTLEAQSSSSALNDEIGQANLRDVVKLKVSGSINSYDMMIIRNKMTNLRELDLEDATIVANDYEYYQGYHSEDNVFGGSFLRDTKIRSVVLPTSVTSIGDYAFYDCTNLNSVSNLEGITNIGNSAFDGCSNLPSIDLPNSLNNIGSGAFYGCSKFTSITIPKGVTSIGDYAFEGCSNLQSVQLSPQTTQISSSAFSGCSRLTEFHLPPYLQSIGDGTFGSCSNLKDIYAYMIDVPTINTNTFNDYQHQILYVPEFLYNKYYYDTNWSQFLDVRKCSLQEGDYEKLYAGTSDATFEEDDERIPGEPDAEIGDQGGVIVEGDEPQPFDDVEQHVDGDGDGGSLIGDGGDGDSNNNMPVNNLKVKIQVRANRWYFFCFPFDVTIADCEYPGQYVWREYDGLIRALHGANGWKNVEGTTLTARKGYIFQTATAGTLVVTFDQPTFGGNRPASLETYACDNAANASWNFVGNPYSSHYAIDENDFTAPITVWNGSSYQAYRPGDDDYHLQPYEAFFVQKPGSTNQIGFGKERRETYRQSKVKKEHQAKVRRVQGIASERSLINLNISDNETASVDKTRLVLNEKASRNYELECDAAKFMSDEATAQLYTVENGVQMAINERPTDGDIQLGYMAKQAGTLRIEASRMDIPMELVDTKMGTTFDLSLGDYEFQTEAGTFNKRFMLRPTSEATAIKNLTEKTGVAVGTQDGGLSIGGAEGKPISIYTANGIQVAQQSGNGFVSLPSGLYLVQVDGQSAKIYVK